MKRSYALMGLMMVAGGLSAQSPLSGIRRAPKGLAPAVQVRPAVRPHGGDARGGGNCLLSEDFEATTVAALTNAGWSIGPPVERQDDQTGQGTGQYTDAWRIADAGTGSSTYMTIPDEPPGNHFIVANDDGDPCNCDMADVGLTTPAMDFTGQVDMSVSFRAYADAAFGGDTAQLAVSTDNGTTWTDVYTVPPVEGAWQSLVVHLGAYDNSPSVKLRWHWSDEGEWATGIAVDDICVSPILPNNLTVQAVHAADVRMTNGATPNHIDYSYMPLEQAQPLDITVALLNNGGQAQTNVVADAEVFMNGVSQGTFSSDPLPSLAAEARDSIVINTNWTPDEQGEVRIEVSVHADESEGFPGDNEGLTVMQMTGEGQAHNYSQWGQDDNAANSFSNGGGTDPYKVGNLFEVLTEGSVAYGVGVVFGDLDAGTVVNAQLLDANTQNFDPIVGSDDFTLQPWMSSNAGEHNFTFIPFTTPMALEVNTEVIGALIHFGGADVRWANSGVSLIRTTFINHNNESDWFYLTSTPMIRLYLANAPVGVEEVKGNGLSLGPNVPNPFNDNTTIQYELDEARPVTITVTNVDGKVVLVRDLGRQGRGRHAFDVDATQLAAGMYSYTLTAGEDRLTRRMVIAK